MPSISLRPMLATLLAFGLACTASSATAAAGATRIHEAPVAGYIVSAANVDAARAAVRAAGGAVERELAIVDSVAARLTARQADALRTAPGVRVHPDRALATDAKRTTSEDSTMSTFLTTALRTISATTTTTDGTAVKTSAYLYETNYPALVGADVLHDAGTTGEGVTIAVLDSGLWTGGADAFAGRVLASVDFVGDGAATDDPYGHGTHVTSIAAGGARNVAGNYLGVAPAASLVVVRAFDRHGAGRYSDVIAGLEWIVRNRKTYKIRVLNLSFGAPPQSHYWDDPLNRAVMAAWQSGIVVVASAGNEGPDPMTIGVPGNVPYVITASALTDSYTPFDGGDDRLASFASTGPTYEGFVKPELVAPGGHMVATMNPASFLQQLDPAAANSLFSLFTMSGTSQAAAVTTGVVALMLQTEPSLRPDDVKCRLLSSARAAVAADGRLAYSVFQQGAGLVDARAAVSSTAKGCANRGLDIAADLAGTAHFGGPANMDAKGGFYVMDLDAGTWGQPLDADGFTWSSGYTWSQGYTWSRGGVFANGYTWSRGYTWNQGYTWTQGYTWSRGYTWNNSVPWWGMPATVPAVTAPASLAPWVPNE